MSVSRDPVCGVTVQPSAAAGESTHDGRTYHFCSNECRRVFEADPAKYAGDRPGLERHEPPHTTTGRFTAPKFGAAGSGGAEYERLPEAHDEEPRR